MRLVCLHTDTVDALKRLHIRFDDLTPNGLWSTQYHLVGLTPDQFDALGVFQIEAEDITPAQVIQASGDRKQPLADAGASGVAPTAGQVAATQGTSGGQRPTLADRPESPATGADASGREPVRASGGEAEVPLAQTRDTAASPADAKAQGKPNGKSSPQPIAPAIVAQPSAPPAPGAPQQSPQKGGKVGPPIAQPQQGNRKGQPVQGQGGGGQRYGTTRLRISVAGKYTEATVANGKIIVAGRSFDSPDQAAAELTKSRGDWTFWEYYDSTDGKWRMLTRDWDTVLKSASPGGR